MNFLLIRPDSGQLYHTGGPDLGLGFLKTALIQTGARVRVFDELKKAAFRQKLETVLEEFEPDAIGIKMYSADITATRRLIDRITCKRPKIPIIVGGPFPSGALNRVFDLCSSRIDLALAGESECAAAPLTTALSQNAGFDQVPGLIWRDGDRIRSNPPEFLADLDQAALPNFTDMPPQHYPIDFTGQPYIPVMTTRGCPFNCAYCAVKRINGAGLRRRSPEMVGQEIITLRDNHGIVSFNLVDDNFTTDRRHALAVCEEIRRCAPEMKWRCTNGIRLDTLDESLLLAMEDAGCTEIYAAIETGSSRLAEEMNRQTSLEVLVDKVKLIRRTTNFHILGLFMIGFPTETPAELRQTIRLSLDLPLDRAAFSYFTPVIGTRAFDILEQQDPDLGRRRIGSYDQIPQIPRVLTARQLYYWQKIAYFRFYLRPRIILSLLRSLHGPAPAWRMFKRIVTVVFER